MTFSQFVRLAHRTAWGLVAIGIFVVSAAALWALLVNAGDNTHEVQKGMLYRSAQLSASNLEDVIRQHGIETVINLRGAHPKEKWYVDEMRVSHNLNVRHIDFKLSASREPDVRTIQQLDKLMQDSPKPILVHCQGGADRSGLASAIYKRTLMGARAEEAKKQLSFYYGHFPWLWSKSGAMDLAFKRYMETPHTILIGKN